MSEDLRAIYMVNGLIYVAEMSQIQSNEGGINITRPLAFMPQQGGKMAMMEAFPFSDINDSFHIETTSIVTIANVSDKNIKKQYTDSIKEIRGRQSGLILS